MASNMYSGQDVEYVLLNQSACEYKIIPESEVSVCQGADGVTLWVYEKEQQESEEIQIPQDDQGKSLVEVEEDIVYVEAADEGVAVEQCIEQHESVVEINEETEAFNEMVEHGTIEMQTSEENEDTRFVMVNDQEVLVVKKANTTSKNGLSSLNEHSIKQSPSSEARLMKARRRTPQQSQKKGPKLIQDFLLPHLDNGTFGHRLVWVDRAAGQFAMSWSHKNGAEWRADDCIVFREWDRLKQRDVVESHRQYWMESKQRFRAALAKVSIPCVIDSEEYKSSKIFQIKWTRETRPDILDRVYTASKYFELPPRGSMGRIEPTITQEEVHDGFFVETYTEEEVVASANTYAHNEQNLQVEGQEIEISSKQIVDEGSLQAAVSSVTDPNHAVFIQDRHSIEVIQDFQQNDVMSEQFYTNQLEVQPTGSANEAAAQQAAAAVLSSRFFTARKRHDAKRRPIRKETLRPVECILRRVKKHFNRIYTICPLCRFFSSNYAVLLRHLMIHRDDRAYACLHCTETFRLPELLIDHLRKHHHGGGPNVCFLSNLEAKSAAKLRRAEFRLVHKNLRTCAVCAEHCLTQHDLLLHIEELHGIDAVKEVKRAARAARRRSRIRMRRKFLIVPQKKRQRKCKDEVKGCARTGGRPVKSKRTKFLSNDEHQTSLVVCDGEVLIEEAPIDWGEQVLE